MSKQTPATEKIEFTITLELERVDGYLGLRQELATVDEPDAPVDRVDVEYPVPMSYFFRARSGERYGVNLRPLINHAIHRIGEIKVGDQ